MKDATADSNNMGRGYKSIIQDLGNHSVPEGWVQRLKFNDKGDVPGPPIQWQKPEDSDNAQPGYGYIPTDPTNVEDIFFYHSDHLGSTSYITDAKANITQFDAYLPYGELLVDEHSSTEEMPYKFNGKELDEETGLYYYGARYMNPVASIWYGVDPLFEKYPSISPYVYCHGNPMNRIDPDGMDDFFDEKGKFIRRTDSGTAVMVMQGNMFRNITKIDFTDNKSVIQNIGRHYLAKADKSDFNLTVSNTGGNIPPDAVFSNDAGSQNYDIYLTNGYVNKTLGDCNDFECVTFHESTHRYDKSTHGGTIGEVYAIIRTAKECPAWHFASDNHIQSQASYAARSLNSYVENNSVAIPNNVVQNLNGAFIGYATFEINNNKVSVNNLLEEVIIWRGM